MLRWASETRTPVVTRGAGTGLSGAAAAVDGCLVLSTVRMRELRIDADDLVRRGTARRGQRRAEGGGARARPDLPARPELVRREHHRRQHRHQRRRPALREIRRHPRLRPRPRSRPRRRASCSARRTDGQGRRRLRPATAVRRQRRHARASSPGRRCDCARSRPRPATLVASFPDLEAGGRAVSAIVRSRDHVVRRDHGRRRGPCRRALPADGPRRRAWSACWSSSPTLRPGWLDVQAAERHLRRARRRLHRDDRGPRRGRDVHGRAPGRDPRTVRVGSAARRGHRGPPVEDRRPARRGPSHRGRDATPRSPPSAMPATATSTH